MLINKVFKQIKKLFSKSLYKYITNSILLGSSVSCMMLLTSRDTASAMTVCANAPIPEGYIIRLIFNTSGCGPFNNSGLGNAYFSYLVVVPFSRLVDGQLDKAYTQIATSGVLGILMEMDEMI
ncbi:hypothetical protein A6770_22185 [Nostoc minutum NIES-26]|uniref:Uncharacterized protein n=1 Tax=Nostoc minutum NIES-26 TaxID=1844469 RepID=A0A367R1W8_9NOSO|nr:hypothetical protein A6770_22185 [Nostoc minutum NIES-26]